MLKLAYILFYGGVKMKKIVFSILLLVFSFSLVACSMAKTQESASQRAITKQSLEPKQVVENYFKYYNEKNLKEVNSTRTQWSQITTELDKDIKSIKLDSITEDTRPSAKESYIKYGHGKVTGATGDNVVIFQIQYTAKFKIGAITTEGGDNFAKTCIVIRKDKNSPWLIDEIGEG